MFLRKSLFAICYIMIGQIRLTEPKHTPTSLIEETCMLGKSEALCTNPVQTGIGVGDSVW
jgi:hypothetical protein